MVRQPAYNSLWAIEFRKLTGTIKRQWALIVVMVGFTALPWLTLRNFEDRFDSYSWFYLDDSILNFVIYSTAGKLSWIMMLTLPWIFYSLFSEEMSNFFRKKNKLFTQLIASKLIIYTSIGGILMGVTWFSTLWVYNYWCQQHEIIVEPNAWSTIGSLFLHLLIQTLSLFPLMVVVFLIFSKKWSYIVLVFILIFSALWIFRLPFHFYFNVQRPEYNMEWTFHSILAACILTVGLLIYYNNISKKTYVFP